MIHSKGDDDIPVATAVVVEAVPQPSLELLALMTPFCRAHAEQHGKEFRTVVNDLVQWSIAEAPKFNMTWEEYIREYIAQREAEEEASRNQNNLKAAAAAAAADPPPAHTIEYKEVIPKLLFVDMQQEDEEKVAAAFKKLKDLLRYSNANWKANADQAFSLGAIAIVLLLMRKWHCNRSIQFHGCDVLAWLTRLTNGRKVTNDVSIVKSGGIETTMAAMKSFPDDDGIQDSGCSAIGNVFLHNADPTIDKVMACFVHELNGIELVVQVMKKFHDNALVQEKCCHVLLQLSKKQALRDALKKRGALVAVGEAAEKHDGSKETTKAFFQNMFGNNS